uniref:Uncharacterized protein n=1 Tax=Timema poppense TaxID=170557 RepID=A0A7R9DSV0_TIMPO|nr:unnamed protein product [Timema poppensis]
MHQYPPAERVGKHDNGSVITWGRNTYGQLGSQESQGSETWKPQFVQGLKNVKQMCVGSEHNIVILDNGDVMSWGWNEHGNCGTGSLENVTTPAFLDTLRKTSLIGAGAGHSFAVIEPDY